MQNTFDDVDVCTLAVTAKIIHFSGNTLAEGRPNTSAMIVHINPIAHLQTISVHRQRFVLPGMSNHERYQFLGELKRSVVVTTPGDHCIHAMSVHKRSYKTIGAGL